MAKPSKLNRNVVLVSLTSFFTDVSSEMLYPQIQAFVGIILSAQKALVGPVLGLVEGIAESTAGLSKVFFGFWSDKLQKRKSPTLAGYVLSALSKGMLFLATLGWPFVLASRFLDRVGKGIRTAPRDALIAESASKATRGRAFGFHRAMDFAGAAVGVLICYAVSLKFLDPVSGNLNDMHAFFVLFALSLIPAAAGILFLLPVREGIPASRQGADRPKPSFDIRRYDKNLRWFFLAQGLFTLGNSSNQFLLLRSRSLGHHMPAVILMYMAFNVTTSLLSTFFGSLSDRLGRKRLLMSGYGLYALTYTAFGWISTGGKNLLWPVWIFYGVYYAMTEGVEKALVADLSPEHSRATAQGMFQTIVGIGLLPASLIAGLLYAWNPAAPFLFGGATTMVSIALLAVLHVPKQSV